jgi:hypothetical protein
MTLENLTQEEKLARHRAQIKKWMQENKDKKKIYNKRYNEKKKAQKLAARHHFVNSVNCAQNNNNVQ